MKKELKKKTHTVSRNKNYTYRYIAYESSNEKQTCKQKLCEYSVQNRLFLITKRQILYMIFNNLIKFAYKKKDERAL